MWACLWWASSNSWLNWNINISRSSPDGCQCCDWQWELHCDHWVDSTHKWSPVHCYNNSYPYISYHPSHHHTRHHCLHTNEHHCKLQHQLHCHCGLYRDMWWTQGSKHYGLYGYSTKLRSVEPQTKNLKVTLLLLPACAWYSHVWLWKRLAHNNRSVYTLSESAVALFYVGLTQIIQHMYSSINTNPLFTSRDS